MSTFFIAPNIADANKVGIIYNKERMTYLLNKNTYTYTIFTFFIYRDMKKTEILCYFLRISV